ncbi:MAG: hypothetical protein KA165_05125 [Saprospiraceae bacterium]|nr:hypothetical protein [Saprospiraceae bacterium]
MLRIINIGLLIAFSLCYLEWGQGQSSFIFQVIYELFSKKSDLAGSLTHPLILAGLIGHLLLLYCIFKKTPDKRINTIGVLILSPVVLLVLLAGALSMNLKIVASSLPFTILSVLYFLKYRKQTYS